MISKDLEHGPNRTIPDNIVIYTQYGWKLGVHQETTIDIMVKEVVQKAMMDQ